VDKTDRKGLPFRTPFRRKQPGEHSGKNNQEKRARRGQSGKDNQQRERRGELGQYSLTENSQD
jgi:hypothetical protein